MNIFRHKQVTSCLLHKPWDILVKLYQYYTCWWTRSWLHQAISGHPINLVRQAGPYFNINNRYDDSHYKDKMAVRSSIFIIGIPIEMTGRFLISVRGDLNMMMSSNGNIFRVTGALCGEFSDHLWIPRTKANDVELWGFLWSAPEWTIE